ncbi:efflux RND transporter periplasmic adaptor subunit [Methylobacter luteus]|uniref:efflux RND transporter periplasmic adaptor subunit n=1 Tax=Methylobacter luteus TaxID=415 RepID=UPI0003F72E9F|nr:efflux RND transporter periplasmic adaptor subunit [Methylobacter luteus]
MNDVIKSLIFLALILLTACNDQNTGVGNQAPKPKAYDFTHYTDKTELFVEFRALTVGQASLFAAHFSRLSDFQPVAEGTITVILSSKDQPTERFSTDSPSVPGIFVVKAEPRYAGQRQLTVELASKAFTVRHALGEVPVYPDLAAALAAAGAEQEADSGDIPFLKEQQWKIDFATEAIGRHELQQSVRALGTLRASAGNEAYVSAPTSGHVLTPADVLPKVGMPVQQGQILASLAARLSGTSDMAQLELDVQKARAADQLARSELNRLQQLFEAEAVAKRRVIEAQSRAKVTGAELNAAEKRLEQTRRQAVGRASGVPVYAPVSGILAQVTVASGSYVEEGEKLFHIINPDTLWLEARIAEADMAQLNTPERVSFIARDGVYAASPSGTGAAKVDGFTSDFQIQLGENGKLISYGQVIDPVTRTVPMVVEFQNLQRQLSVGSLVQTRIYTGEKITSIAVPEAALIDDNGQDVVFVQSGGESFQRRVLRLGLRDRGFVQVLSGVNEGERVVTKGAYLVFLAASSPAQLGAHGHAH